MHAVMSKALKLEFDAEDGPLEEVLGLMKVLVLNTRRALRLIVGGNEQE